MPNIDELYDIVDDLRDELALTKARLEATRDKLTTIGGITEERVLRIECAMAAYAHAAKTGPHAAAGVLADALRDRD